MKKVLLLLWFSTLLLQAHSLKVFLTQEDDKLGVYSYFTKSSPCLNCKIEVSDLDGNLFDIGITDAKGKASFGLKKQHFKVVVEASMGHRGEVEYSLEHPIKEETDTQDILKAFFALVGIGVFFGLLYLIKRKKD